MPTSMTGYSSGLGNKTPKGYSQYTMPTMDPQSAEMRSQQLGAIQPGIMSGIGQLSGMASGDQSFYNQLEAPAYRQFQGAMGALGSRFAGMGTGALKSSGFQNLGRSLSSDFALGLQQQRMGLQRQAMSDLLGLSNQLMQRQPYATGLYETPEKTPLWRNLVAAGLPIAGGVAGGLAGGPAGAKLGLGIGSAAGKAFL